MSAELFQIQNELNAKLTDLHSQDSTVLPNSHTLKKTALLYYQALL